MKTPLAVLATACLLCGAAVAGNYTLTIDGEEHEIGIGEPQSIMLRDGRSFSVTLDEKAVVSFTMESFSFDHPSRVSPSRTDLGGGLYQTMMAAPTGTLIIVQEFTTMDPSGFIDMMLNEVTKEEAQYGYNITRAPATKVLADGTALAGKTAVSSYRGTEFTRHVLCYSARDAGLLIMTQVEKASPREDMEMIDLFWRTLKVSPQ